MLKFLYVYFLTGHITLYQLDSEDHSFGKNALSHVLLNRLIHPMYHHRRKGWLLVDDTGIKKKRKKWRGRRHGEWCGSWTWAGSKSLSSNRTGGKAAYLENNPISVRTHWLWPSIWVCCFGPQSWNSLSRPSVSACTFSWHTSKSLQGCTHTRWRIRQYFNRNTYWVQV